MLTIRVRKKDKLYLAACWGAQYFAFNFVWAGLRFAMEWADTIIVNNLVPIGMGLFTA